MRVAVLDVGSNSIKLLVAERAGDDLVTELLSRTLEVRISGGIGSGAPRLGEDGMKRGIAAVKELSAQARQMGADPIAGVATSAVRDAANGPEFRERVRTETGLDLRILSGLEEANLIGRGLATDPGLSALRDFHLFDLGGGSLECVAFLDRGMTSATSLPLGCVRLTERFVPDAAQPLSETSAGEVARHVRDTLARSGFPFPVPAGFGVVGTGGTLTSVRVIDAANRGIALNRTESLIEVSLLRRLLARVGPLDLGGRKAIEGLSPQRADVFPVALATLISLAELGAIAAFRHSFRNLRWGVADELLRP